MLEESVVIRPDDLRAPPTARRVVSCLVVCLVGVTAAAYSLAQIYQLRDEGLGAPSLCSINAVFDCHAAHASRHAVVFGIPISFFAALYYGWASLTLTYGLVRPARRRATLRAVFLTSLLSLGVTVWKGIVLVFVIRVLCPVCLILYAVSIAVFFLSLERPGVTLGDTWRRVRRLVREGFRHGLAWLRPGRVWAYCLGLAALLGAGAWCFMANEGAALSRKEMAVTEEVLRFYREPVVQVSVPADAPTWGAEDAPVHVVVFSDFECPFCRLAATRLRANLRDHPRYIRYTFLHFPLDPSVNQHVKYASHPRAGEAARAAVLAQEHGVFWEFHDALYEDARHVGRDFYEEWFGRLDVPAEGVRAALEGPRTAEVVRSHAEIGHALGVEATPTFFVNGREVKRFFPRVLRAILIEELRRVGVTLEADVAAR